MQLKSFLPLYRKRIENIVSDCISPLQYCCLWHYQAQTKRKKEVECLAVGTHSQLVTEKIFQTSKAKVRQPVYIEIDHTGSGAVRMLRTIRSIFVNGVLFCGFVHHPTFSIKSLVQKEDCVTFVFVHHPTFSYLKSCLEGYQECCSRLCKFRTISRVVLPSNGGFFSSALCTTAPYFLQLNPLSKQI